MKRKKADTIFMVSFFLVYLLLNGILLILHEPWRDEANVWLMARELSPVQLLREIKYQGHPCLWYFLVMPFAKVGLPFRTIEIMSLLIMAFTAGIFWWKGPLHKAVKLLCLFSPIFTYFYPVIARNYCLIALFLMLLAWQYPEREKHGIRYGLLLGLLVQADTIAIPIAGLISVMWLADCLVVCLRTKAFGAIKKVLAGIWIPAVSFLFWILQFYQVSDSPQFQMRELGTKEIFREIRNFSFSILIRMTGRGQLFCRLFLAGCLIAFLVLSVKLKNGWAFGGLLGSFLFYAAFSAMVYQLHIWHYISLGFIFMWSVWVLQKQMEEKDVSDKLGKGMSGMAEALLMLLAVCMFMHWNSSDEPSNLHGALHGVYSDGKNAAAFMEENLSSDDLIVTDNIPLTSTVLAYLKDYEFHYAGTMQKESYADWSEEQSVSIRYQDLIVKVKELYPNRKVFFILQTGDSCIHDAEELGDQEMIYQSKDRTTSDEEYKIFKIWLQ